MKKFMTIATLLAMMLAMFSIAFAATVQVGSGNTTGSTLPISGNWGYSYTQQIYTQDQINKSGDINKIRFYYSSGTIATSKDWVIYMGHTTKTTFSSTTDWEPSANLTEVFSGDITSLVPLGGNWMEITLDTPFPYDNIDNLIVAVDENTSGYGIVYWGSFTSADNTGLYYRSDSNNPNPATPPTATGRTGGLAQIQFVFPDTVPPLAPTLVSPANSGSAFTNGKLSWNTTSGGGDATKYDVFFGETSTPPLVSFEQTGTDFTPTLVANATYYWNVVAKNGIGSSPASPTWSFTTVAGVEIGESTSTALNLPLNPFYGFNYSQNLYLQSEIDLSGQRIEKLYYNWNGLAAGTNSKDWTIYMGHTAKTAFASTSDWVAVGDMSQVFSGVVTIPANPGWIEITLTAPFIYNNVDNLVIAINETTTGNDGSSGKFFGTSFANNRGLRIQRDGTVPYDPAAPLTGTLVAGIANIRMQFGEIPTVPVILVSLDAWDFGTQIINTTTPKEFTISNTGGAPLEISSLNVSGIGFALADPFASDPLPVGESTSFTVNFAPIAAGAHSGTINITSNAGTVEIDLTGTCHDPTISSFPKTYNFGTLTTDAFPPLDWTRYSGVLADPINLGAEGSGYWRQANWMNIATPANKAAKLNIYGSYNGWLISPAIAVPGNDYQVIFDVAYMKCNNNDAPVMTGTDDQFAVLIGDGTSWSTANVERLWDNAGSPYVLNDIPPAGITVSVPLGAAGIKYVAFYAGSTVSNADNDLMVDNITFRQTPAYGILAVSPDPVAFGTGYLGVQKKITVSMNNTGGAAFNVNSIALDSSTNFQLDGLPTLPLTINPADDPITFDVIFAPTATGELTANLLIGDTRSNSSIEISGTGVTPLVGEICENPYLITALPLVDYEGTTVGYADDYTSAMFAGTSSSYHNGYDWVAKVSIPNLGALTVSVGNPVGNTTSQYLGVFLVNTIPSLASPAEVLGQATASSGTVIISAVTVTAGDYYIIVDNWAAPDGVDFVLNVSFESAENPPEAANLVSPTPSGTTGIALTPTLSWSSGGGIVQKYFVSYGTQNPYTTILNNHDNGMETTYGPLPTLDYSTEYWWTVTPWNEIGGNATGVTPWAFTTIPDPTQPLPYLQDFDSGTSLAAINWTGNMSITSTHGNNGTNGLYKNVWSATSNSNVVSCPIGPMVADAELKFDYRIMTYSGYPSSGFAIGDNTIEAQISTDGGINFTPVHTIDQGNHVTSNEFATVIVPLDAYSSGNIFVKFLSTWALGDYFVDIDNVMVRETPVGAPDVATLTYPTDNATGLPLAGFNLSWTPALTGGTATSYTVYMASSAETLYEEEIFNGILGTSFNPVTEGLMSFNYEERWFWTVEAVNGDGSTVEETPFQFQIEEDPTITSFPFVEGFEEGNTDQSTAIKDWTQINGPEFDSQYWMTNSSGTTYDRTPRTGAWNATLRYDGQSCLLRPIELTAGTAYSIELFARQNTTNSDNAKLQVNYGTEASFDGMTETIIPETGLINGDYQRLYGLFTPATTGLYYIGIQGWLNISPWYISLDDITVDLAPTTPIFAYTPESMEFGSNAANALTDYQNVTVSNIGSQILNLTAANLSLTGTDPTQFEFTTTTGFPAALASGESVSIPVRFAPTSVGDKAATLRISYAGEDYDVSLTGYAYPENSLVESFEGGVIPSNWTVINVDGGVNSWVASTTNPRTGSYSARIGFETSSLDNDDWLITPPLQVTSETTDNISFWLRSYSDTYDDPWEVLISSTNTNPTSFTMIDSGTGSLGAYVEKSYNLDTYGDAIIYLAVRYIGAYDWSLYVDDFVGPPIYVAPFPPSAVTMDNPAAEATMQPRTGFNFAWTAGEADGVPTSYSFYLATSAASIQNEFSAESLTATSYNPVGKPYGAGTFSFDTWGQRWYWQVEAHNEYGSTLSEIRWFEIQTDPTITTFPWSDGFEAYDDFATTFAPWTGVDVDGSITYGFNGTTFPGMGDPMSYIVFNPATTDPAMDSDAAIPHGGDKFAACLASDGEVNDDWLITPPIVVQDGLEFSFWAKTYMDYGLENFNVAVSTTGMAPEDFTVISGTTPLEAPLDWTQYSYPLSAYNGFTIYVAIQCVSDDVFIFMVDDVLLRIAPTEIDAPVVSIAADGTLSWAPVSDAASYIISKSTIPEGPFTYATTVIAPQSSWLDPTFGADKMFYQVQASTDAPAKNVAIRNSSTEIPSDLRAQKALKKPAVFKK